MQKLAIKLITLILIGYLLIGGIFIVIFGRATPISIKVEYGSAPDIDGFIDRSNNEWNDALKNDFYLYPNLTNPENGLAIKLWLLQTENNLYFSIQFELENHDSEDNIHEFVGLLIASSDTADQDDFIDAKIVRFNNLSSGDFNFSDDYIEDGVFNTDLVQNGIGAAKLEEDKIVYEFSLPIRHNQSESEDVYLNYGFNSKKVFRVVFGRNELSFDAFFQNEVIVELQFPPYNPPLSIIEILLLTFNIIIFGTTGLLFMVYIYRIAHLKKKIKKIKS